MERNIPILCTTSSYNYADYPERIQLIKNPLKRRLTEDEVIGLIKEHDPVGIISGVEQLTEKVFNNAAGLKVISRCGIDTETIDQKAAKKMGILVFSTHLAPDVPAAELTVAMILSLLRQLNKLDTLVRNNQWDRIITSLLYGKTVGIIGCGIIGSRVSYLLSAFGCQLLGYDPFVRRHDFCEIVDFNVLISTSDIITLHVPLREENYHIIGQEEFGKMKEGVLIINTSRGGLIDENALVDALRSGKAGGAAIDVFEEEPYQGPLIEFRENTILTPHIGSFAGTYRFDIEKEAMDNLVEGLRKQGVEV